MHVSVYLSSSGLSIRTRNWREKEERTGNEGRRALPHQIQGGRRPMARRFALSGRRGRDEDSSDNGWMFSRRPTDRATTTKAKFGGDAFTCFAAADPTSTVCDLFMPIELTVRSWALWGCPCRMQAVEFP
jgi:hypothetical protein